MKKYLIHFMSIDMPSVEDDGMSDGTNFGIYEKTFKCHTSSDNETMHILKIHFSRWNIWIIHQTSFTKFFTKHSYHKKTFFCNLTKPPIFTIPTYLHARSKHRYCMASIKCVC